MTRLKHIHTHGWWVYAFYRAKYTIWYVKIPCESDLIFDGVEAEPPAGLQRTQTNVVNCRHCYHKPIPSMTREDLASK